MDATRVVLNTLSEPDEMLAPSVVESVYAAAAARPPLREPRRVARTFAELYAEARHFPGALMVTATVGEAAVGFAYGHSWTWAAATDRWSRELRERLDSAAVARIDNSFAVQLLAVLPEASSAGLGRRLLSTLLAATPHEVAWLQTTDVDSPARRLYLATGWTVLGHGPPAPDGNPGLVLIKNHAHEASSARS